MPKIKIIPPACFADGGSDDGTVIWEIVEAAPSPLADGGSDDGTIVWEILEATCDHSTPPQYLQWSPGRNNAVAAGLSLAARTGVTYGPVITLKPKG